MADGRLFSDTESDVEDFEGFDARDTRPYAVIASKASLFQPSLPKAKRVCIDSDDSDISNLDERSMSLDENVTREKRFSSPSSVEGEVAPDIFKYVPAKYGAIHSEDSTNEGISSSSLEGELSYPAPVNMESKQQPSVVSPVKCALEQAKEKEASELSSKRKGKTSRLVSLSRKILPIVAGSNL